MNQLIKDVIQWGIDKQITGPNGKGTKKGQAEKMMEEAVETRDAVLEAIAIQGFCVSQDWSSEIPDRVLEKTKDGIGDTMVTLILLAEMHGWTIQECLQVAYDVISKRTGRMIDGAFVKSSDLPDDDLGELDPAKACKLDGEGCKSCQ